MIHNMLHSGAPCNNKCLRELVLGPPVAWVLSGLSSAGRKGPGRPSGGADRLEIRAIVFLPARTGSRFPQCGEPLRSREACPEAATAATQTRRQTLLSQQSRIHFADHTARHVSRSIRPAGPTSKPSPSAPRVHLEAHPLLPTSKPSGGAVPKPAPRYFRRW